MRAVLVVIDQPLIGNRLDLLKVGGQARVEHLGSISSIEALNESVLIWLARLDIADRDALALTHWGNASEILSGPLSSRIASVGP